MVAAEVQAMVRRAAGDTTGKTVGAQIRQAARALGYEAEAWRVREAWYGRAGGWSAAAVDDLRQHHAAWERRQIATRDAGHRTALLKEVRATRRALALLDRRLARIEAELGDVKTGDDP